MNLKEEIDKLEEEKLLIENKIYNEIEHKIYKKNLLYENILKIENNLNKCSEIKKDIEKDFINNDLEQNKINKLNEILKIKINLEYILNGIDKYVNMSDQINELKILFNENTDDYLKINEKIDELNNIKNILKNQNIGDNIKNKINKLDELNNEFIQMCLNYIRNNFITENKNFEIMNNVFYILKSKSNEKEIIDAIKTSIDKRFEKKLKDKTELVEILGNFNFSVDDLLDIHNNKINIIENYFKDKNWQVFYEIENIYKNNIEKYISPIFKNLEKIKESPGILIYLINWINSYEKLLDKVGVLNLDYKELKNNIELYLPIFKTHLIELFDNVMSNILKNDKFYEDEYLSNFFQNNENFVLESNFSYDLYFFHNEQLEILIGNIPEDLLISINIEWLKLINIFLGRIKNEIKSKNSNDLVLILKYILNINNYYNLYLNLNKIKKKINDSLTKYDLIEKLNLDFNNLFIQINNYQNDYINLMIDLLNKPLLENYAINFFRLKWFEDNNYIFDSLEFIKNNVLIMSKYFKNKILNYKFEKLVFSKLIDYYNLSFIWIIQNIFHKDKILKNFNGIDYLYFVKKEKNRKKLKDKFKNKDIFLHLLNNDIEIYNSFINNNKFLNNSKDIKKFNILHCFINKIPLQNLKLEYEEFLIEAVDNLLKIFK